MVVSFLGAAAGNANISVGNIIGSNIMNTMLILGLTSLLLPITITDSNKKKDIPINLIFTCILVALGIISAGLGRIDGAILLTLFAAYMYWSFKNGKEEFAIEEEEEKQNLPYSIFLIVASVAALFFGGRMFVNSAISLANAIGVSDKFIAITLLAGGTSMPELATCVAAAVKKKGQLALGNIIGSNIFNMFLILGGASLINPLNFKDITYVDISMLVVSAACLAIWPYIGKKNTIGKFEGIVMLILFATYITYISFNF